MNKPTLAKEPSFQQAQAAVGNASPLTNSISKIARPVNLLRGPE